MSFLDAVVGPAGAVALSKAVEQSSELGGAVMARAITAWVDVVSRRGHDGELPGCPGVALEFRKSERGTFTGSVDIDGQPYRFRDESVYHLVGAVAVAMGADVDRTLGVSDDKLFRLGKSITLLVKAHACAEAMGKASAEPAGGVAKPIGPAEPAAPQPTQPRQRKPQLPRPRRQMKVHSSVAKSACPVCGGRRFDDQRRYVGCECYESLAKSVRTQVIDEQHVMLSFGEQWDEDAFLTLARELGK